MTGAIAWVRDEDVIYLVAHLADDVIGELAALPRGRRIVGPLLVPRLGFGFAAVHCVSCQLSAIAALETDWERVKAQHSCPAVSLDPALGR